MKKIVFAGGCFWGVEAYFNLINGVTKTIVGYANGLTKNPTYEDVKTGTTGHAEAVYIEYEEKILSLQKILEAFWTVVDPTIKDSQGPDIGNQYRTGIYYLDENDLTTIKITLQKEQSKYNSPIVTEVEPLRFFYHAEEYHQDYLKKNPTGYCHIDLSKYW
ncbi:MAG: peptide-methionine (S)-S-oxide reductase MsrA [Eubacteriales bacterium]